MRNFILVTGLPRSGTTAVGSLLALADRTFYLYEPTNFHAGDRAVSDYFLVPGTPRFPTEQAKALYDRVLSLDMRLKSGVWNHEKGRRKLLKRLLGGRTKNSYRYCKYNPFVQTVVWKDPFMMFSLEHMLQHYDFPIVVTQRPVEALAASFKRFRWGFDVKRLLSDLPYAPELKQAALRLDYSDPVRNAAALYSLARLELARLGASRRLLVTDLDDLLSRPEQTVANLYAHCGLPFTEQVRNKVRATYAKRGGQAYSNVKAHVRNRDLTKVNSYWSEVLSADDLANILDVSERFGLAAHQPDVA